MRFVNKIAAVLVVLAGSRANGQCVNGQCYLPASPPPEKVSLNDQYEWKEYNADQTFLYRNGNIVGQWYGPDSSYYQWESGKNIGPIKPPIDPPYARVAGGLQHWQTAGVTGRQDRELTTHRGRVIHQSQIQAAFEGKLDDDSNKGYITIIAKDPAKRAEIISALPSDFRSRYNVWATDPGHFSLQDRFSAKPRFYTEGDPTVVLQSADGSVLFRRPQANEVFKLADVQDLLKADPNYNPKLDPGAPAPIVAAPAFSVQTVTAGVVSLFAGLLFLRRKQ